jgi:hypothetical protein
MAATMVHVRVDEKTIASSQDAGRDGLVHIRRRPHVASPRSRGEGIAFEVRTRHRFRAPPILRDQCRPAGGSPPETGGSNRRSANSRAGG